MHSVANKRFIRLTTYFQNIFVALLLIVLAGCAGDVNMLSTLSEKTKLEHEQGIVVVRVINASSYPLPFNQVTITPKNLNESKKIKPSRLQAIYAPLTNSTVFASPIASGSYSFDSIRSFHIQGDYWYSHFVPSDAKFGTFEIKPGQVTDLGTIIYYPKPQNDKVLNILVRQEPEVAGKILDQFLPFYQYDKSHITGWRDDEFEENRNAIYVSAAQNPVTYNKIYLAPDGSIYFIGKLGVILKRSAEGEWSVDAVDTNLDLFAIAQNERGDLVVGGNEGKLFIKLINDEQWQDISLAATHNIEEVNFTAHNELEVITKQLYQVNVFRVPLAFNDNSQWQPMLTYDSIKGWQHKVYGNFSTTIKTPKKRKKKKLKRIVTVSTIKEGQQNRIIVSTATGKDYVFDQGVKTEFSYDPTTWKILDKVTGSTISKIFPAGVKVMGIKYAGFWSWTGQPSYFVKDDYDQQWQRIKTRIISCREGFKHKGKYCYSDKAQEKEKRERFSFVSIPWFDTEQHGLAIVSFSDYNFWTGQRKSEIKIIETHDGGKTWEKTPLTLPNDYCGSLVTQVKDRLLLSCKGYSSDFYESVDQGLTWQLVREHENF